MKDTNTTKQRPPVVVIMGHIDHGKSTLLDYIRKTNQTAKEAGGITQHVSAYEAECNIGGEKKIITFLDTPGHEAFCSIRERGSQVADIAILVVSGEDGVKPQTIEALKCINNDKLPFIVAITKIDKPGANIDKVKQSLAEQEVFVEGWGGTVPVVPLSSKTGEGVEDLLEMISLQADLENFVGDTSKKASGFILESNLNPNTGISSTLIIKEGSMAIGMYVATRGAYTPIRNMVNSGNVQIKEAHFSTPIKIVGWNNPPFVGSEFMTFDNKDDAIKYAEESNKQKEEDHSFVAETYFPIIIKTDAFGSLDAVIHELEKLNTPKIAIKIVSKGVGAITETDIKTANIKKSLVVGFNVSADKSAESLALREHTDVKTYTIIYELVDYVKVKLKEATPVETVETMTGRLKIIRVFSKNKDKQVVGGRVEEGEIKLNSTVRILRRESVIGEGKIRELQVQKIKNDTATEGQECGLMIESKIELTPSDQIQAISLIRQE